MPGSRGLLVALLVTPIWLLIGCDGPGTGTRTTATGSTSPQNPTTTAGHRVNHSPGPFRFTDMTDEAGVRLTHVSGTSDQKPFPAANGSGVGVADFDRDGRPDLCFATGTPLPARPGQQRPTTRLLWNRLSKRASGRDDWQFDDVTEQSHLAHDGYSAGVAVGDFDGDGFPDVFFNCFGRNALFHNLGDGTFMEIAAAAGVDDPRWGTSACFLDADNDGLLDLYLCHYARWSLETNTFCGDRGRGIRVFCNPGSVEPISNVLLGNNGDGSFEDITASSGLARQPGRSQGVVASDVNLDGHIDLYIANDLHPNFLFLGDGEGGFRDASETSGAAYSELGQSQAGMGVDSADLDGDGRPELFVTNFEKEHNSLYANLGDAQFQDVAHLRGVAAKALPWVGWGTALADFDGDGPLDIVVTNGHTDHNIAELHIDRDYLQPALLWHNRHRGRFVEATAGAGTYFQAGNRHAGRGLATVDIDNDADLDLVITHLDAAPALLRNDQANSLPHAGVQLWLIGTASNRDAVGSRLVFGDTPRPVPVQQVQSGASYLSSSDPRQLAAGLAAGQTGRATAWTVSVTWASGRRDRLELPGPGCYALIEGSTTGSGSRVVRLDRPNSNPLGR